jgi:hypothetical protein
VQSASLRQLGELVLIMFVLPASGLLLDSHSIEDPLDERQLACPYLALKVVCRILLEALLRDGFWASFANSSLFLIRLLNPGLEIHSSLSSGLPGLKLLRLLNPQLI